MVGIESYGAALPTLRLPASAYVTAWGSCQARGMKQKAFCAYDEDAVTLGIEAARAALGRLGRDVKIAALFFGATTPPYDEKPSAATLPTALFADGAMRVTEISGSPQAGMQALLSAMEFCKAHDGAWALAVAADAPAAPPDAGFEHALGAGAAAFVVGPGGAAAEPIGDFGVTRETFGARFRRHGETALSDLELRTRDREAALAALGRVLKAANVKAPDRIALGADAGLARGVGKALNSPEATVDALWTEIGDAGAASAPLALAQALDEAKAGEIVLAAAIGAGATAALLRAGSGLDGLRANGRKVAELAAAGRAVDYVTYLKQRRVLSSRFGGKG
jgi:hydroxymethylglutaryl-CoA synthase